MSLLKMQQDVFYDTSIWTNLSALKNEAAFNRFVDDALKRKAFKVPKPFVISTPTLLLETLGHGKIKKVINLKSLNDKVKSLRDEMGFENPVKLLDAVLREVTKAIESSEQLKVEQLLLRLEAKNGYYNPWWTDHVNPVLRNNLLDPEAQQDIYDHLALEVLQDINYEDFLANDDLKAITSHLLFYLYSCSLQASKNFFMTRTALKRPRVFRFEGAGLIETGQDYADMEMLHFVLMGNKRESCRWPVTAFSYESKRRTVARIAIYYSTLKHIHGLFKDAKKPFQTKPGVVHHVCRHSGKLIGVTHVQQILNHMDSGKFALIEGLTTA